MGMTNEEAKEFIVQSVKDDVDIAKVADAIKALEQQPTDAKTYLKRREENYVEYNVEWFLKNWELELEILSGGKIKPTDADCISRAQALHACCDEWNKDYKAIMKSIRQLPPVTPQPKMGRWINNKCDKCGASRPSLFDNYCPNCGAKMEVSE